MFLIINEKKTPKSSEDQQVRIRKLSRKLVNQLYKQKSAIVIDDEKYFTFSCDEMPGNTGYYTDNKETVPDYVRFKGKEKYPTKILVWLAISEHGISKPLIRKVKSEAIDQVIYREECLQKKLLPFIQEHYPHSDYIFWPDLAKAHYAKANVTWMEENLNFVAKDSNPPNVPQARPIENFWGCLTQKVYEGGWEAKSEQQLVRRIKNKLKEFDFSYLQSIMKGVKSKLRNIADSGYYSYWKK